MLAKPCILLTLRVNTKVGAGCKALAGPLNAEYVYGANGRLQNAAFLDYRIPVCSDLPMIDTQILEIPNPHPPLWCTRRGRNFNRAAIGCHRQCHFTRRRRADDPHTDVSTPRIEGTEVEESLI